MRTLKHATVLWALPAVAIAHSTNEASSDAGEIFLICLLFAFAAWYAIGSTRVLTASTAGRAGLFKRSALFGGGWLVIAVSLLSPLHTLGGRSFTAHMIEHELLMLVAAPLIAWSRPLGVLLWAFPRPVRLSLGQVGHRHWFSSSWSAMSSAIGATLIQTITLWLWHAPAFFNRALLSESWHAAQHISLVFSALLFWWSMSRAAAERRHGVAAFWLFFTSLQSGLLGALMSFAEGPWYARYVELGLSGTFGLTPLEDQQLAGLIMWIPGGAIHAIVALWYLHRWLKAPGLRCLPTILVFMTLAVPVWARELRVCADPNNLPFSNRQEQGFENRLIALLAHDIGATVTYAWWAQRRGNVRNTLEEDVCDVIPGVSASVEMLDTTRPYYRSAYVFVTRRDRHLHLSGFDDARLRRLTIGVQMIGDDFSNTPPAHSLTNRGIVTNVRGYMVYGNYANTAPARSIIDAVADGSVDVAIVWGPTAGYFAANGTIPLLLEPVQPLLDGPWLPMTFAISMGVRKGNRALRRDLDGALDRNKDAIDRILRDYHVPLIAQ